MGLSLLPDETTQLTHARRRPVNILRRRETEVLRCSCTHSRADTQTRLHADTRAHTALSETQCPETVHGQPVLAGADGQVQGREEMARLAG